MENELFWKLLEPVHPMAAAFCHKLAGDRDEGDDLYQDALLRALRRFRTLRDHKAFRPWLFRIIINSHKNRRRTFWWRRRRPLTTELIETCPGDDPRARRHTRRMLAALLAALTPDNRALVILHEIDGWSTAELAVMFEKPEGTVKNRIFRAKQAMRGRLEKRLPKPETFFFEHEAIYALRRSKAANE